MGEEPLDRFARLVRRAEADLPLDEAALLVATCIRPVDVAEGLARLDDLAAACPARDAAGVARHLFVDMAFTGDTTDYDDPRNSFLDEVVTRRRGLPIVLSVLMIEVARRVDVAVVGIGMPGHFIVRDAGYADRFFDPFYAGVQLDLAGVEARFHAVRGDEPFRLDYVAPVGPRGILSRMLANLQRSFLSRRPNAVVAVARMRWAIPGLSLPERHQIATLLGSLGHYDEAAAMLEEVVDRLAGADADRVRRQVIALRARGN